MRHLYLIVRGVASLSMAALIGAAVFFSHSGLMQVVAALLKVMS